MHEETEQLLHGGDNGVAKGQCGNILVISD